MMLELEKPTDGASDANRVENCIVKSSLSVGAAEEDTRFAHHNHYDMFYDVRAHPIAESSLVWSASNKLHNFGPALFACCWTRLASGLLRAES